LRAWAAKRTKAGEGCPRANHSLGDDACKRAARGAVVELRGSSTHVLGRL